MPALASRMALHDDAAEQVLGRESVAVRSRHLAGVAELALDWGSVALRPRQFTVVAEQVLDRERVALRSRQVAARVAKT